MEMADAEEEIQIKVKTMDASDLSLSLNKNSSIETLKSSISKKLGIEISNQRLIFQGKLLKNNDTLQSYNIKQGHVLHLVVNSPPQRGEGPDRVSGESGGEDIDDDVFERIIRSITNQIAIRRTNRRFLFQQNAQALVRNNHLNIRESLDVINQNLHSLENLTSSIIPAINKPPGGRIFKLKKRKFQIGQWIDCKDTIDQWLEAQIIKIENNKGYIHYNGWGTRWDEWIGLDSPRIQMFRTHTIQLPSIPYMGASPNIPPDSEGMDPLPPTQSLSALLPQITKYLELAASMIDSYIPIAERDPIPLPPRHHVEEEKKEEIFNFRSSAGSMGHHPPNPFLGSLEYPLPPQPPRERSVYEEEEEEESEYESSESIDMSEEESSDSSSDSIPQCKSKRKKGPPHKRKGRPKSKKKSRGGHRQRRQATPATHNSEEGRIRRESGSSRSPLEPFIESKSKMLAAQIAPIFDRLGRLLVDSAPHFEHISAPQRYETTTETAGRNGFIGGGNNGSLHNRGQRRLSIDQSRQLPLIANRGDVAVITNLIDRFLFGDAPSVELHVHAIMVPRTGGGSGGIVGSEVSGEAGIVGGLPIHAGIQLSGGSVDMSNEHNNNNNIGLEPPLNRVAVPTESSGAAPESESQAIPILEAQAAPNLEAQAAPTPAPISRMRDIGVGMGSGHPPWEVANRHLNNRPTRDMGVGMDTGGVTIHSSNATRVNQATSPILTTNTIMPERGISERGELDEQENPFQIATEYPETHTNPNIRHPNRREPRITTTCSLAPGGDQTHRRESVPELTSPTFPGEVGEISSEMGGIENMEHLEHMEHIRGKQPRKLREVDNNNSNNSNNIPVQRATICGSSTTTTQRTTAQKGMKKGFPTMKHTVIRDTPTRTTGKAIGKEFSIRSSQIDAMHGSAYSMSNKKKVTGGNTNSNSNSKDTGISRVPQNVPGFHRAQTLSKRAITHHNSDARNTHRSKSPKPDRK